MLAVIADVLDQLLHVGMLRVDVGALVGAGQEGRVPVLRRHDGIAAGTHRDEAGKVLVLAAQAVRHPGAHAGPRQPAVAAIHQHQGRLVIGNIGVHRTDNADIIDAAGRPGEQFADLDAVLAVALELVRRTHGAGGLAFGAQVRRRQRLAVELVEGRLGIEGIDVRRAAVHEQMHDAPRLRGEVRRLRRQRIHRIIAAVGGAQEPGIAENAGQSEPRHAEAATAEQITASQEWQVRHGGSPGRRVNHLFSFQERTQRRSSFSSRFSGLGCVGQLGFVLRRFVSRSAK